MLSIAGRIYLTAASVASRELQGFRDQAAQNNLLPIRRPATTKGLGFYLIGLLKTGNVGSPHPPNRKHNKSQLPRPTHPPSPGSTPSRRDHIASG